MIKNVLLTTFIWIPGYFVALNLITGFDGTFWLAVAYHFVVIGIIGLKFYRASLRALEWKEDS